MDYTIMATNTIRKETNMYDRIQSICFHKLRMIEDYLVDRYLSEIKTVLSSQEVIHF